MDKGIRSVLESVRSGETSVQDALLQLKKQPFEDIGYAKVDYHRAVRQGTDEVIYGQGKTPDQIVGIAQNMAEHGLRNILITRVEPQVYAEIKDKIEAVYYDMAKIAVAYPEEHAERAGKIAVVSAGTSDMKVCEEAAITAETLGSNVVRIYDVGVSGIHRLLSRLDDIMSANAVIAVAGMEGALASVVGGLADCPVIAVPTSVGYGANFGGLSALLAMLNSCSAGVSVVNIDNGFGAGYLANMINRTAAGK